MLELFPAFFGVLITSEALCSSEVVHDCLHFPRERSGVVDGEVMDCARMIGGAMIFIIEY